MPNGKLGEILVNLPSLISYWCHLGALIAQRTIPFLSPGVSRPPHLLALENVRQDTAQVSLATLPVLLSIQELCASHSLLDFFLQLCLGIEHPLMAHRFVFGKIGLHLDAIECPKVEAHHDSLLAEAQDLHKQPTERLKLLAAELA